MGDIADVREELVSYAARLITAGLVTGTSGNISARIGDIVAITPSGVSQLRPRDVCLVGADGTELDAPRTPSTELPMHLAIYAAVETQAIVHTHSPEVIALSAHRDELPAIHYAITALGGPVPVVPYARFGSTELAASAAAAMAADPRRRAVILRNHGAVTHGASIAEAHRHAELLEWLARVYRLTLGYGTAPRILSATELAEVTDEMARRRYGE